ncbi:MAG: aminoglycoside phosphotransferase family protein, partial [Blastocatellia bacterium]
MTQLPVAERERLVRRAVDDAIRKRRGSIQAEPITHEDSAGMRSFFAIYPKYALEELMAAECAGWSDQKVCALSSGYSGSSLLQITGLKDAAPKQIVIKLAPRRDVIEAETHVLDDKYRGEGGVYAGKCAQPSQLKDLPEKLGFYSIQESVPGRTLMSLLTDEAVSKDMAKAALRTVIDLSVEQYKRGWYAKKVDEHEKKLKRFEFTEIDIDRARQACAFLRDIGHALSTRAQWPRTAAKVEQVFSVIEHLLSTWQSNLSRAAPFEWVLQHGDLNPHNIMIGAAGQITFIDLARIGHWPVGYDLSRLAIQLRMRLVDRAGTADWFGDHLTDWYEEPIWAIGNEANPHPLCWPAALCEQALTEFVNTREEEGRAVLYTGSRVGALFDLLRILSYNDL